MDQSLATTLVRMWADRNKKKGQNIYDLTQTYPKKADRVDRGKGWWKLQDPNFNPDDYQDTHLPDGVQYGGKYKSQLKESSIYIFCGAVGFLDNSSQKAENHKFGQSSLIPLLIYLLLA